MNLSTEAHVGRLIVRRLRLRETERDIEEDKEIQGDTKRYRRRQAWGRYRQGHRKAYKDI